MKLVVAIFAILTAIPLSAEEILVPPPQLNQVAKAHHCSLLIWAERENRPLRSCEADRATRARCMAEDST
jgi:hypothetical protein